MKEKFSSSRPSRPDAPTLRLLVGKISDPKTVVSKKPGFEGERTIRLVESGAGLMGLKDGGDNKEWSGMNNHILTTTRLATYLGTKLAGLGYGDSHPQTILRSHLASHLGRRQWDEAGWYGGAVEKAQEKRSVTNEVLGIQILEKEHAPQEIIDLVKGLAHGHKADDVIYSTLDYHIALYADHRVGQNIEPLSKRMAEFLMGNFIPREALTPEKKNDIYAIMEDIVQKGRLQTADTSEFQAESINKFVEKGVNTTSPRLSLDAFMGLVFEDIRTEVELIKAGIHPDTITEESVPVPRWERYLRRLYIHDAEQEIFQRFSEVEGNQNVLDKEFPQNSWWGKNVGEIYKRQNGISYESKRGKKFGIQRAIDFFGKLDAKKKE